MASTAQSGSLAPGHYLFDANGQLLQATALSSTTEPSAEQTAFDLSGALSLPQLPASLRPYVHSLARGETTLPQIVSLDPETTATLYPIELNQEKFIALVISPNAPACQPTQTTASLLAVSRAIHAGRTMEEIFQTLAREVIQFLPFDRTSITLFKPDTNEVEVYALQGDGSSSVQAGTIVPGDKTVTAWVVSHGQPVVVPDIRQETRFVTYAEWSEQGYRSTLCHPLTLDSKVIGTLNFTSRTVGAYCDATVELVTPLAEQVAVAINNTRLRQRLTQESQRLRRIVEVANQVKHHLSLNIGYLSVSEILRWMCEVACDMGWERAIFCLRDPALTSANDSFIAAFAGTFSDAQRVELDVLSSQRTKVGGFSTTPGARISGVHRRVGDHSFIVGRNTESPLRLWHPGTIVIVPLALEGRLFGTFSVDRHGPDPLPEEVEILELLTDHATVVLHNSRLIGQLQEQLAETQRLREQEREHHLQMQQTERLRALGELASGVAHNFNNALTIIQGRISLLKTHVTDATLLRSLDIIHTVSKDAANIVKRIQDFARVRQDDSDFERLDLSQLVQQTIEATQPKWMERTSGTLVRVTCQAPAPVYILGNPTELREVVTNLVFNALDAMPNGGEIIINVYEQNESAKLVVRDTGLGMNEETKKRLFDPFYTTKGGKGTGLGLSVSHNIISRHRGRIEVESELGRGTTFFLTLPLTPRSLAQELVVESVPQLPPRQLRILIVDDERPVAETVSDIIALVGHLPTIETNPTQALQRLRTESFDALFTDLGMPDINGWQLIAEARAIVPGLSITLVTGWAARLHPRDLQAQRVRLIPKPVDIQIVERTLSEIVCELRATLH
ncbi:MAG: ATP-binding protein [Chloracidobacterium sp.]